MPWYVDPSPEGIAAWGASILGTVAVAMGLRKRNNTDAAKRTEEDVGTSVLITIRQERDAWRARAEKAEAQRMEDARTIAVLQERVTGMAEDIERLNRRSLGLFDMLVAVLPDRPELLAFRPSSLGDLDIIKRPEGKSP